MSSVLLLLFSSIVKIKQSRGSRRAFTVPLPPITQHAFLYVLIGRVLWCHAGPGAFEMQPHLLFTHESSRPPNKDRVSLTYSTLTAFDNGSLTAAREREKESRPAGLLMRRLLCSLTCPHAFLPHHFTAVKNKRHESAAYNYPRTWAAPARDAASTNLSFSLLLTAISLPDNKTLPCHFIHDYLTLKNTMFFSSTPHRGKVWCVHMAVAMKCQDMNKNAVSPFRGAKRFHR